MTIDAAAYLRDMAAARVEFPRAAREVVARLADAGAQQATSSTLFKDRSGDLRRRIYSREEGGGFAVVADTPYAFWVQNGRGPVTAGSRGVLVSHRGKSAVHRVGTGMRMLRFVVNGQVFFRRSVRAAAPRPFMPDGNTNDGDLDLELDAIADEVLSPLWS